MFFMLEAQICLKKNYLVALWQLNDWKELEKRSGN